MQDAIWEQTVDSPRVHFLTVIAKVMDVVAGPGHVSNNLSHLAITPHSCRESMIEELDPEFGGLWYTQRPSRPMLSFLLLTNNFQLVGPTLSLIQHNSSA